MVGGALVGTGAVVLGVVGSAGVALEAGMAGIIAATVRFTSGHFTMADDITDRIAAAIHFRNRRRCGRLI